MQEWVEEALSLSSSARATEVIRFSNYDFARIEWLDGGKEFRHNGVMYDIVRSWHEADSIAIECFRDDKETKILANITSKEKRSSDATQSSDNSSLLAKNFSKYLSSGPASEAIESLVLIYFLGYTFPEIKSNSPEIPTPPPRFYIALK